MHVILDENPTNETQDLLPSASGSRPKTQKTHLKSTPGTGASKTIVRTNESSGPTENHVATRDEIVDSYLFFLLRIALIISIICTCVFETSIRDAMRKWNMGATLGVLVTFVSLCPLYMFKKCKEHIRLAKSENMKEQLESTRTRIVWTLVLFTLSTGFLSGYASVKLHSDNYGHLIFVTFFGIAGVLALHKVFHMLFLYKKGESISYAEENIGNFINNALWCAVLVVFAVMTFAVDDFKKSGFFFCISILVGGVYFRVVLKAKNQSLQSEDEPGHYLYYGAVPYAYLAATVVYFVYNCAGNLSTTPKKNESYFAFFVRLEKEEMENEKKEPYDQI